MMKIILYISLVAICMALLSGCGGAQRQDSSDRPLLAVSIEPQRKILEELVGDRFEVVSAMPAGANPETYDPSMSTRAKISEAKAYFSTGRLPFEEAITAGLTVIDTSQGIIPVYGTHDHGGEDDARHHHSHGDEAHHHSHGEPDPHIWTSLRNAKAMAYAMLSQLAANDPANADEYRTNFSKMIARYDSIDSEISRRLANAHVGAFAVWHPSLSYFARDYGLRQIAVGHESKEMPIGRLKEVIEEAREDSVKVFFFQKEYDSRQAESLNREIGSRIVDINPLAYDWEQQLILVADELAK